MTRCYEPHEDGDYSNVTLLISGPNTDDNTAKREIINNCN